MKKGKGLISIFRKYYCQTIEEIANTVNELSEFIPKRRERMLHVGLLAMPEGLGRKSSRAITFTAVLYSFFGIPPELIGTGRGLGML